MSVGQVRMRVPEKAKAGDVVTVRVLITHPMQIMEFQAGQPVNRNYIYINHVEATYNGKKVFEAETSQAISQNPLFVFSVKVNEPGIVKVNFRDTDGKTFSGEAAIKF